MHDRGRANGVGVPIYSFAAQWLAYRRPCRRFAPGLAADGARLGADAVRYSFIVVDFHHLLLAGLPAHYHRNNLITQLSRLIDEALRGEIVTIMRNGKAVVSLTPMATAPLPLTKNDIDEMRRRAEARPCLGGDSVTLVREMRDAEP